MQIDVLDDYEALTRVGDSWNAVFEADPHSHYFLSHAWFKGWLQRTSFSWFILAAKPSAESDYVAFFPLQIEPEFDEKSGFLGEIKMGGAEFADYTGFICRPEFEAEVTKAFATHIKKMSWMKMSLTAFRVSDQRCDRFLEAFAAPKFVVEPVERFFARQQLNNNIYPQIMLPDSWDRYVAEYLSANTRQKAKRFLKRLDEGTELRITHSETQGKEVFERDLKLMLAFWDTKWRPEKKERAAPQLANYRVALRGTFDAGNLFMPILWANDKPVAGLGTLLDRKNKRMHFLVTGRDEEFNSPPPGFILHCYSIRWAIENGYKVYDFLQGNEPYKYMFGPKELHIKCFAITTKNKQNLGETLDKRSLSTAYRKCADMHKEGKTANAERGLKQILDADPQHADALLMMATIELGRARDAEAAKYLKAHLAAKPANHEAWLKLGKIQQAQKDNDGAIKSLKKVLELDAQNREAQQLLLTLYPLQPAKPASSPAKPAFSILSK